MSDFVSNNFSSPDCVVSDGVPTGNSNMLQIAECDREKASNFYIEVRDDVKSKRDEDNNGITVQYFDTKEPLSIFKKLLGDLWNVNLSDYTIWLQDVKKLDENMNLADQCVDSKDKVQIKLQIKINGNGEKVINILDIFKSVEVIDTTEIKSNKSSSSSIVKWVEAQSFMQEQHLHNIPADPMGWNVNHVQVWIKWAIKTFNLQGIEPSDWLIPGSTVCSMTPEQYKQKVPSDPHNYFLTHLEILSKYKQVAMHTKIEKYVQPFENTAAAAEHDVSNETNSCTIHIGGVNKGSVNHVHLWQFLLELLINKDNVDIIEWLNDDGEFRFIRPEIVAQLWGQKKRKKNMNYEKLSRALRYYYDGDMIAKVQGKRFVYKFLSNIKEIIGYSPMELKKRINECKNS